MNKSITTIKSKITQEIDRLIKSETFKGWFKGQNARNGDLIFLNNSFIFRKPLIKTRKNEQFICIKIKNNDVASSEIFIAKPNDFNVNFKLFSGKSRNLPEMVPIGKALDNELKNIGPLVFLLIGDLQETSCMVAVNHRVIKELRYNPRCTESCIVDTDNGHKAIFVNQLSDHERAWEEIKKLYGKSEGDEVSNLEIAFAEAFERLHNEIHTSLNLPIPGEMRERGSMTLLSKFRTSVTEQHRLYSEALNKHNDNEQNYDSNLGEIMRIAYNFAEDAIKVLALLVSIADLKALISWCTIKEHFDLAEAFNNLPWNKSHEKASFSNYQKIISGARNRAFHNLLALDGTVEANLEGVQVGARRLTLFPPYSQRKNNISFDYEDRELVEVLSELTRAPETMVPHDFWQKNEEVIVSFESLLDSTEEALWMINAARIP